MPIDTLASLDSIEQRWAAIRQIFLDKVWIGLLVIALLAVPMSVSRAYSVGWQPVFVVHLVFMVVVIAAFVLRKRLSYRQRAILSLVLLDVTAFAGLLNFGLLGSAWWWMFIASLLTGMYFSIRGGLIHAAAVMLLLVLTAAGYIQGVLAIDFDANQYVMQTSSWATMMTGPALMTVFVFWAIGTFHEATLELLQEVDQRREQKARLVTQLEESLAEIKILRGFIPICAHCRKIRDDKGYWESVEAFMRKHADIQFTHGLCPPCGIELYGDVWRKAMEDAGKIGHENKD